MFPLYVTYCLCFFLTGFFKLTDAHVPTNGSLPSPKARQLDDLHHESPTSLTRQWPEASYLLPNSAMSTLLPIAIFIGIGIILLKLFILSLWIFGRSGAPLGGYGLPMTPYNAGYPGYHSLSSAYSSGGWRGDGSGIAARSMVDKSGLPLSPFIGNKLLSLVSKVTEAMEGADKRYNANGSKL
ncbi:uncharacterized protein LOC128386815 [Panonychus citri]|uniref:uncharacterized protein LOC128386815 n=1 Tax=Panonychus citri TaxID=50023 RepID=UPI00230747E9|nr:uncharacterized protein LOC128386815 [Panonychus citri]